MRYVKVMSLTDRIARLWSPYAPPTTARPPDRLAPFMRWALRDMRAPLGWLLFFNLAIGVVEVGLIVGIGALVDRVASGAPETFLGDNALFLVGLGALVLIGRPLAVLGAGVWTSWIVGPNLQPGTIWRLHRYSLGQSVRFFDDDFAGRLAQKEMQAGASMVSLVIDSLNAVGMLVSFLIGMSLALGQADWRLGLVALVWAAVYAVILRVTLPVIRRRARARAEERAGVTGRVVDAFATIRAVILFDQRGDEEREAQSSLEGLRRASIEFGTALMALRAALAALNAAAMLGALAFALWLWTGGAVSVGVVAATGVFILRLSAMSNWIAMTFLSIFSELGAIEDAVGALSKPHDVTDDPGAPAAPEPERLGHPAGRVRFQNVSFAYGRALSAGVGVHGIDFEAAPGERVGLVGPSGAGKSTIISLLLRLYDPEDGRILLDGADIRRVAQGSVRRRVSVVTQETALFNRSALDNIRYGMPDASAEAVAAAAEAARADGFIQTLQDRAGRTGYAAQLGERGVKLSGGQRQRIALARAILKDAPVLVLDEATSALDSETEAEILGGLETAMTGKTVIAIAHRLSTLGAMDRLLVLEGGRIIEQGRHDSLLEADGLYARLWRRQSGGFIGGAAAE